MPDNNKFKYLAALLSGAMLVFSFAPFNIYPIAWLSVAVFFYLNLADLPFWQRVRLSWVYGIGIFLGGAHWIYFSVNVVSHSHWSLAATFAFLFAIFVAIFTISFGLLSHFLQKHSTTSKLLIGFPAAWVLTEWFRGWIFTGFPWLFTGYSQTDTVLNNIAPITGVLGISWFNALISGALLLLIIGKNKQRQIALVAIFSIFSLNFGLSFIDWTKPSGKPIKVAMLQGNIEQKLKWLPEQRNPTLDMYSSMTEKHWDADVIVWPETAIPDYFYTAFEDVIAPLHRKGIETKTDLVLGGFFYNPQTNGSYNSIMSVTQDENIDIYSKQHLVPFSEYFPFLQYLQWLKAWIELPYDSVQHGEGKTTLNIAGHTARATVCYEDAYGEENIIGLPEADLLINLSNDGWFAGSIEPEQHMQIARMRAIETGRSMIRSTNTGVSGLIDRDGTITATAPAYTQVAVTGNIQAYIGSTPFIRWGNVLIITIMLGLYGFALFSLKNKH